ncbi:MAG: isoleucine--tRNA ligase [Patescibacteria group bacterium]
MINIPEKELEILKFWQDNQIFKKTLEKESPNGDYVFYDGPPFATGTPHYGHILGSVAKDVIPRYFTMKGYHVPRRWGWDCHGLPIENLVEKKLEISGKKDIEDKIGVENFNKECCADVLMYTKEWKKMVERIGRWIEFDNSYKTMNTSYMESVWWALKTIWNKNLIYEGKKVLMYCPRCETPVSKAEINMDNSYKDIEEETVTVSFKIIEPEKYNLPQDTYILAWTTTPWTLPANVALAVGRDLNYVLVERDKKRYILVEDLLDNYFKQNFKQIKKIKGEKLVGIEYEPLVDIPMIRETGKKAWYVTDADFVTTEDGTGVVHTAVVYGEEDYELGLEKDLPVLPLLDEKSKFNKFSPDFIRGKYFKEAENDIIEYLEDNDLLFSKKKYIHSYPHCWRCETQLFYNAISAWFIDIQKTKERMIELNKKINWYPAHLKNGRFLNILETAPDWNISRNRYWATPLPFWKCNNEECGCQECMGSIEDLKERGFNFNEVYNGEDLQNIDLHKHKVDKIKLKCEKCGSEMTRIPEVIDCWVESASMPFAEHHYPFENKEKFKKRFPGEYIAEYIAQTRAWFYYMHALSTLLFDEISFKNCVTTGTILSEKGEKLSKSKRNFTDPWDIIEKYGMDALRYYLMSSVVMKSDNLFFNDKEVDEIYKKVLLILYNILSFYKMFAGEYKQECLVEGDWENVLDKWILAKTEELKNNITKAYDNYDLVKATRPIGEFINELSTWYVRRSRDRFKSEDIKDKINALKTLQHVLFNLARVIAPVMPYTAEYIYRELQGRKESVHLEDWPKVQEEFLDQKVLDYMEITRKVVELGLAKRAEAGIKVRQPLQQLKVSGQQLADEYLELIKDELNVKEIICVAGSGELSVELTIELNAELIQEGLLRELVRTINQMRKQAGLSIADRIDIKYNTTDQNLKEVFSEFGEELKKQTLADSLLVGDNLGKAKVNDFELGLGISKR